MVLEQETRDMYGYSVQDMILKNKKTFLVVCACPVCGSIKSKRYDNAIKKPTCGHKCGAVKAKQTSMERYGASHTSCMKETIDKMRQTNIDKYGHECSAHGVSTQNKIKKTLQERYGVDRICDSLSIREKIRDTLTNKYGGPSAFCDRSMRHKSVDTMLKKYGTTSTWKIAKGSGNTVEDKIMETLNGFGCNFKEGKIPESTKLLDMYDDNIKLAIEYNGLFWHNEKSLSPRGKFYHYDKMVVCKKHGIRLIQIFEDEWITRQQQIIGFIKASIGKCENRVFARKTEIREIDDSTAQSFYDDYHIQGRTNKGIKSAGLYYNDALIAAMTFGKHHRGKDGLVLTRLCFKYDWCVVGGASKMFKFLCDATKATEVISWSDNRWSVGGVYESLGFLKDDELGPDYGYVCVDRPTKIISKQSQKKKTTKCPDGMTELEWATQRGLARIWDCGKIRWKWTKPHLD